MILENAPVFSAAGSGLSALYNVDFYGDLSHNIPSDGTWQGDRKSARSLYIDNYNNSFSILVTTRGGTVRCPGYSQGIVPLSPGDDVTVISESAAVVQMTLYTEQKSPGFTSRGVAPIVAPVPPYTVAGTISLTTNNRPDFLLYQPYDTNLYAVCATSKLVVKIDPLQNVVISATPISKTVSCACVGPNGSLLLGTSDGYYISYDTVTGIESAAVDIDPSTTAVTSIAWNATQSKVWATCSIDNLPFNFNIDGTAISSKIGSYSLNKLLADANGDMYGIYTVPPYNFAKIVVGSSTTTISNITFPSQPFGFDKVGSGNIFVGLAGSIRIYDANLSFVSTVNVSQGGNCRPVKVASNNGRIYVGNSTGIITAIDSSLRGIVGTVPNIGGDVISLTYAENSRKYYAGIGTGFISYINNS